MIDNTIKAEWTNADALDLQPTYNQLATDCISRQPEKRTEKRTETHACDCISRQAVINTVRTIILGFFSDEDGVMTDTEKTLLSVNKAICDGVRALPSAQQDCTECEDYDHETKSCPKYCDVIRQTVEEAKQERTGRWLPDNRPGGGFWVCSNCKFPSEAFAADKLYKYCPVCGARMEDTNETD